MDYSLTVRFDDEIHSLSAKNGLSIDTVGELLVSLSKAVGLKKDGKLTLSEINGNCYALCFTTPVESVYCEMEIVHRKISENNLSELNYEQKKYAIKLNSIIKEGYRVNVYNSNEEFNYRIACTSPENKAEFYFEIEDVYGIIASIGSSSLEAQPSIKLSREGYDIHITNIQEKKLIKHFKKDRLLFTIKKKINFETNKVESATLIVFEETTGRSNGTFSDNAEKLKQQYKKRGLFPKVKDSSSAVRNLRGSVNLNQLINDE